MMAAVQPFLSGAISKTCNVPHEATVAEIRGAYLEGWKLGLKALAIYRDGSKGSQPVSTKAESNDGAGTGRRGRSGTTIGGCVERRRSSARLAGRRGGRAHLAASHSAPPRAVAAYPPQPDSQVRHSGA